MTDERRRLVVGGAVAAVLLLCAVVLVLMISRSSADPEASTTTETCDDVSGTIVGTAGPDELRGTPGDDVIVGKDGDDRIWGLGGNDIICAGPGADVLDGGPGDDSLYGQDDVLAAGQVTPFGDRLIGGPGDDLLDGGGDPRAGGRSFDALDFRDAADPVTVDLNALEASGESEGDDTIVGGVGLTVFGSDGNDTIYGSDGPDRIVPGGGSDKVRTRGGNDLVNTGFDPRDPDAEVPTDQAADLVWLSTGQDTFIGDGGRDFVDGGSGNDSIETRAAVNAPIQVRGGVGDDRLTTYSLPDGTVYDAGGGVDTLAIRQAADAPAAESLLVDLRRGLWELRTGAGLIKGRVVGVEDLDTDVKVGLLRVRGSDADETLLDRGGAAKVRAGMGAGDDVVDAGEGDDLVDGGPGKDTVRGKGGRDICLDAESTGSCEKAPMARDDESDG